MSMEHSRLYSPLLFPELVAYPQLEKSITQIVLKLERGVQESVGKPYFDGELEGDDNGLYSDLVSFAGVLKEDVREVNTTTFLGVRIRGLKMIMVGVNTPLSKAATLAHELGHQFTPRPWDNNTLREYTDCIAEGTAYTVCDYFGLDISERSLPNIANQSNGVLTRKMQDRIKTTSLWMINGVEKIRRVRI